MRLGPIRARPERLAAQVRVELLRRMVDSPNAALADRVRAWLADPSFAARDEHILASALATEPRLRDVLKSAVGDDAAGQEHIAKASTESLFAWSELASNRVADVADRLGGVGGRGITGLASGFPRYDEQRSYQELVERQQRESNLRFAIGLAGTVSLGAGVLRLADVIGDEALISTIGVAVMVVVQQWATAKWNIKG